MSVGPTGGNGAFQPFYVATNATGTAVFFTTGEQLTADDTDSSLDIYQRSRPSHPATTRVSVGDGGAGNGTSNIFFGGISTDGANAFFTTDEGLVPNDANGEFDVYRRNASAGTTGSSRRRTAPAGSGASMPPTRLMAHARSSRRLRP